MKKIFRLDFEEHRNLNEIENIIANYDSIQLYARNINVFRDNFNKYYLILYAFAGKIFSLYAPTEGTIYEDTVLILSELEDKLDIEIRQISIDSIFSEDINLLKEFYYDDLQDGSMRLEIVFNCNKRSRLDLVSGAILADKYFGGITLGINTKIFNQNDNTWSFNECFSNILNYISSFYLNPESDTVKLSQALGKDIVIY